MTSLLTTAFQVFGGGGSGVITDGEALDLLHEFNHQVLLFNVRGVYPVLPRGSFAVSRNGFEKLVAVATGNPMADQRKETEWTLRVNRGGVVFGEQPGMRCKFPDPNDPMRQVVLEFTVPVLSGPRREQ